MVGRRNSRRLATVITVVAVLAGVFSFTTASAAQDSCFFWTPVVTPDQGLTQLIGENQCGMSFQCSTFPCDVQANMFMYGVGVMSGFMEVDMANGQVLRGACGPQPIGCQVNLGTAGFTSGINHVTCIATGVLAVGSAVECHVQYS